MKSFYPPSMTNSCREVAAISSVRVGVPLDSHETGLSALEAMWATSVGAPPPKVKTGQFLRLTVRYLRPYLRRELEVFVYMLLALAFTTVSPRTA